MSILLKVKKEGLYCQDGDFFVDARLPVPVTLITHAHGDHTYFGHGLYIASQDSLELLQHRLGSDAKIKVYPYGEKFKWNNCWVSFHPAGHILGSSQIRIEIRNQIYVVSGDYKRAKDITCAPFEVIKCDVFITESTFALPIYHWENSETIGKQIYSWWQENIAHGVCSIILGYSLGKSQRLLSLLSTITDDPIYVHGAVLSLSEIYAQKGAILRNFLPIQDNKTAIFSKNLVIAPPSAKASPWMKRFYPYKTAIASGWMAVRGMRKQRNVDAGFILSDHGDWNDLINTVHETEASKVFTTHGNSHTLARYLNEQGINASPLQGLEEIESEDD